MSGLTRNPERLAYIRRQLNQRADNLPALDIDPTADIHPTAVVGAAGQGCEWDEAASRWVDMPQVGGVMIGARTIVGPLSTIMRGSVVATRIGPDCRIGNGVNVGHSAFIGRGTLVCAHVTIGGSAYVSCYCRIWQGAVIGHKVVLGEDVQVGAGAVVLHDIPPGETWAGNPARRIA